MTGWRHIVVEGAIGVGKTTLARRLAQALDADLVLERPDENPFLQRFYADMPGYAFQTQLYFLFQRARQVQALTQAGLFARPAVADYLFAKDALFARLTLSDEEHRLYVQMYAQLAREVAEPDLVIWLQASPATLLRRVRERGIPMEQPIDEAYLERLGVAYVEHFRSYSGAPVLAIDTEDFHPARSTPDLTWLLAQVRDALPAPEPP
ncbi:MAG: deoxynucleoside kinase [Burkholderiaceae bacterium]